MRLKWLMYTLLVLGILLMLLWPYVLGPRPPADAERIVLARWAQRSVIYFAVTSFAFLGAASAALLIARRAREQFREENRRNLESLIEGTLRDHEQSSRSED